MSWTIIILIVLQSVFAVPGALVCMLFLCALLQDDQLEEQDRRDRPILDSRS
jgi:hypothetical protein